MHEPLHKLNLRPVGGNLIPCNVLDWPDFNQMFKNIKNPSSTVALANNKTALLDYILQGFTFISFVLVTLGSVFYTFFNDCSLEFKI